MVPLRMFVSPMPMTNTDVDDHTAYMTKPPNLSLTRTPIRLTPTSLAGNKKELLDKAKAPACWGRPVVPGPYKAWW